MATIGDEGYGIYYAAYNVYAFIFTLTISGTSAVIPKLIAEYSSKGEEDDAMASFIIGRRILLVMGILMTGTLFLLSEQLVSFIGYQKAYLAILALCPSILLTAINSSYRSYFQGRNNITPIAISQFVEQVGNTIFTIACSYILMNISLEWGVAGGAMGTAIGASFSLIFLFFVYKKEKKITESKPRSSTNKDILTYMIKYSVPLILSTGLIYAGNNLIDVSNIKSGLLQAGFTESSATIRYGNFGNYIQLMNVPMIIISSLSITAFPIIAKANASLNMDVLKKNIQQIFKICFLIAIPSSVGLSILSSPIFDMIFVTSQSKGSDIMKFGSFIIIFNAMFQLSNTILNSIGKVYKGTFSAMLGVVIKILSNFILIPIASINIYGAIIGLFLSQSIPFVWNHKHIKQHIGTSESLVDSWKKPLISSLFMGAVVAVLYKILNTSLNIILGTYISNALAVLICVYIGALVYIHSLLKIKGLNSDDIETVPSKFRRILFL